MILLSLTFSTHCQSFAPPCNPINKLIRACLYLGSFRLATAASLTYFP